MIEFSQFNSDIVLSLLVSASLGAFLGLRREISAQDKHRDRSFMGFRTMTLIALLGTVSTIFPIVPFLPIIVFIALVVLLAIAYANGAFKLKRIGITSELSAITIFWIGVMVGWDMSVIAVLLTLFLAGLNAFKDELHNFAKTLTNREWIGALQLFLFSGAVLPFLPQTAIDPWGMIIPVKIWLLVMLISGIGFVGYFLIKYMGARGGIPLTALLGALASSTAVTTALSDQSKRSNFTGIFAVGIFIALAVMQLRVAAEIWFFGSGDLVLRLIITAVFMAATSAIIGIYYFRRTALNHKNLSSDVKLDSPFEIMPAIKFGLIFVAVLIALAVGKSEFGESGVYAAALLSGVIDIDAIVLSSLEAVSLGEMSGRVAENAIVIALLVNTVIKIAYVAILGSPKLVRKISIGIVLVTLVGSGVFFMI